MNRNRLGGHPKTKRHVGRRKIQKTSKRQRLRTRSMSCQRKNPTSDRVRVGIEYIWNSTGSCVFTLKVLHEDSGACCVSVPGVCKTMTEYCRRKRHRERTGPGLDSRHLHHFNSTRQFGFRGNNLTSERLRGTFLSDTIIPMLERKTT